MPGGGNEKKFEFISKNSGLRFEFEAHNQTEALQLLQQGKISALALSDGDYLWDGRNNINSTLYYLRAPTSMITRYDSDKLEVIALPQGYQLSEAIKAANPHYTFKYYPSIEDCLNAVTPVICPLFLLWYVKGAKEGS